ncbi:MAG: ATP-binding protein [Bacteroidaceae bacterium]|nr:ATP-binding protein [Bacteroidaceae bacterium]
MSRERYPIKATSHIINLLGDELIGSDSLAIFELVKNAYDADATKVTITFNDLDTPNRNIVIEDNGCGMSSSIIQNVWLTIGTDYKKKQAKVSKKYHRTSLGNKGVGRLAVHRLADEILLESQAEGDLFGSSLSINWKNLIQSEEFIEDLYVEVNEGVLNTFIEGHGTRITLTGLKTKKWTKAILKELAQKIQNIKNPFCEMDSFEIIMLSNDTEKQRWLDETKNPIWILDNSLYSFKFSIGSSQNGRALFSWEYKFNPTNFPSSSGLTIRHKYSPQGNHMLLKPDVFGDVEERQNEQHILLDSDLCLLGPISGIFHVFNQNGKILDLSFGAGKRGAIKDYIKDNCGVKIFRDNIRVYNYGEPSDDWLDLELAKVQRAGDHFSKKVTIGAVFLELENSANGLKEKTNREGFTDNDSYRLLKSIVQEAFNVFEREAISDRDEIEAFTKETSVVKRIGLSETIKELGSQLAERGLQQEFSPLLKKVEKDYNDMRDVMLNSGMSGLNLSLVFHEVEREVRYLNQSLNNGDINVLSIKDRVKSLILLMENFAPIVKQNKKLKITASQLIERVRQIHDTRFKYHDIIFSSPVLTKENADFKIEGPGNLLLSSLSNIIDNAIYWVKVQSELTSDETYRKAIYVGSDIESFEGPAIVIADTGTGFNMEPEDMIQPFRTMRPEGMGLGLYYVNLVMETIGGKLLFPDRDKYDVPEVYNGAFVVLVFPKINL